MNYCKNLFALLLILGVSCATTTVPEETPMVEDDSLLELVESGDVEALKEIFGFNQDVDETNSRSQTALHLASITGNSDIAALLLLRGADPNAKDVLGKTPLWYAVDEENELLVRQLLQYEASLFVKDNENVHPLKLAIDGGKDVLSELFTPITILQEDEFGNQALHYSAEAGRLDIIRTILSKGGDPQRANVFNEKPLDVALKNNTSDHAAVSAFLLENGGGTPSDSSFSYLIEFWPGDVNKILDFGNTPLHYTSSRGHLGWAEFLISNGALIDAQDRPGNTPLHKALENGEMALARMLISRGADVNAQDFGLNSSLHIALTSEEDARAISLLLENGANPNIKNSFGNTPLHLLVTLDKGPELLEMLLSNEGDPNIRNKNGNSALMEALLAGSEPLTRQLLEYRANIFARNNEDRSPLIEALESGKETASWLINSSNLNSQDDGGMSPLHYSILTESELEVLFFLIEKGVDLDQREKNGNTALHLALALDDMEKAQILMEAQSPLFILNNNGVSPLAMIFEKERSIYEPLLTEEFVQKTDANGNTPLFTAIQIGQIEAVESLVRKESDIAHTNYSGSTPLHEAVRYGQTDIAAYLIEMGADVMSRDNIGNTPLHNTVFWESAEMCDLLLENGAALDRKNNDGKTPFHESVRRGQIDLARYFLQKGARLLTRDKDGSLPIFDAVAIGDVRMLEFLLTSGMSLSSRDNQGNTPLHWALKNNSDNVISILVERGSDLFAQNSNSETPLALGIQSDLSTLKSLYNGRMGDIQNDMGNTPLHIGVLLSNSTEIIEYLIEQAFDINARNRNGQSPLDLALTARKQLIAELLLANGAGD